jgi:hypothetical protein
METERSRKRDSARKKSDFSVYSQKAVRAKERLQRAKPVVVQKSNGSLSTCSGKDNGPYGPIGQKSCAARLKDAAKQKPHLKNSK